MGHLTNRLTAGFEVNEGYAAGELDTQVGWTKRGAGTQDLHVIVGSVMDGVQSIAIKNADVTTRCGYEKTITARVASTDEMRFFWRFKVDAAASTGNRIWFGACAGAYSGDFTNADGAFLVAVKDSGTDVTIEVLDSAGTATYTGRIAQGVKCGFRVDIFKSDTWALMIDTDNDGEGWAPVHTGTLVTGEYNFDRVFVGLDAGSSPDDSLHFDALTVTLLGTYAKVSFGDQPQRMAKLTAATRLGEIVTLTADVYDEVTGLVVDTGLTTTMNVSELDPAIASVRVDAALQRIITVYDNASRVTELNTSGHEVLL